MSDRATELIEQPMKESEAKKDQPVHITFFPGLNGTDHSMRPLRDAFDKRGFGIDMLVSHFPPPADDPRPNQVEDVARALVDRLKTDTKSVLCFHSAGNSELPMILEAAQKMDPDFLIDATISW